MSGGLRWADSVSRSEILEWVREHGIEPKDTFRIEIRADAVGMWVYQYERNEAGSRFFDHATGDAAKREPFRIPIKRLPGAASK